MSLKSLHNLVHHYLVTSPLHPPPLALSVPAIFLAVSQISPVLFSLMVFAQRQLSYLLSLSSNITFSRRSPLMVISCFPNEMCIDHQGPYMSLSEILVRSPTLIPLAPVQSQFNPINYLTLPTELPSLILASSFISNVIVHKTWVFYLNFFFEIYYKKI